MQPGGLQTQDDALPPIYSTTISTRLTLINATLKTQLSKEEVENH